MARKERFLDREERLATVLAVVAGAALVFFATTPDTPLRRWDTPLLDLAKREHLHEAPPAGDVTVVLVDDTSLQSLQEHWPLGRITWAKFIEKMAAFEPAVVAIDAWFESPAPTKAVDLADRVYTALEDVEGSEEAPLSTVLKFLDDYIVAEDEDRRLAKAIGDFGGVVLGVACIDAPDDALVPEPPILPVALEETPTARKLAIACGHLSGNVAPLATVARQQASLDVVFDEDGLVRRYAYRMGYKDRIYPTLALSAAMIARPERAEALARATEPFGFEPPDLYYQPSAAFRTLRFSDVLLAPDDSAPLREALHGKLVFVGVSALGTQDYRSTPLEVDKPGVYVQANAAAGLLAGKWLRRDTESAPAGNAWAMLLLVGLGLAGVFIPNLLVVTLLGLAGAAGWAFAALAFLREGTIVPVVAVWAGLGLWVGVRYVFQFRRLSADRERARSIRTAFNQYLAPQVVEALVEDPEKLKLGGERRVITALFTDLAGFTTISEEMEPAELVELLNECLGAATEIVLEEGGIVDKYIGDAIVAMFGAPLEQPDHAARAVRAAMRCQAKLEELRPAWRARGWPEIVMRVGINSGPALVGNMGSERRFDYTMLGDTVNLAARLESANKQYGTTLLVGQETRRLAGDEIVFRELDRVRVKGKNASVSVYEPIALTGEAASRAAPDLALTPEKVRFAERWLAALDAYRAQQWQAAKVALGALASEGDPTSAVLLERVADLEASPPGEGWDGTYTMKTK